MSTDGPNYQHLDGVPESSRRLVKIEILEDLSDSQLVWSVEHAEIPGDKFLSVAAVLSDVTSSVINRLAANQAHHLAKQVRVINETFERLGLPSPLAPKTDINDADIESALRGIEEFLDNNPETDK